MQIHPEDAPGRTGQGESAGPADLARLLRWLRLSPGTPEALEAAVVWSEALALARPATWRVEMHREDFLARFHPFAQASLHLGRVLEGCPRVWLLAATIGPDLEERVAAYFAHDRPFAGYVLDRAGTLLVERAMRGLIRQCGPGLTRRYSPGYKDFALEAQRPLLEMVAQRPLLEMVAQRPLLGMPAQARRAEAAGPGLRLTDGCMLQPGKSITAVAGVRPAS